MPNLFRHLLVIFGRLRNKSTMTESHPVIARFFVEKSWQSILCHAELISASPRYFYEIAEQVRNDRRKNRLPRKIKDFARNDGKINYRHCEIFRRKIVAIYFMSCRIYFGIYSLFWEIAEQARNDR